MKKILKASGKIILLLVIYTAVTCIVTLGICLIHIFYQRSLAAGGSAADYESIPENLGSYVASNTDLILIISILITVPCYLLIYRKRKRELSSFCLFKPLSSGIIPVIIIYALSLNVIVDALLSMLSSIDALTGLFNSYSQVQDYILGGSFAVSIVVTGIIAPLFEEILFRGLIFGELRKITRVRTAIVIQALIFGIYHFNVVQSTYAFLIGLILGYAYYRSSSIISSMLIHMTINSSSMILSFFVTNEQFEKYGPAFFAVSILLFVILGVYIFRNKSFKRKMDDALYENNRKTGGQTLT